MTPGNQIQVRRILSRDEHGLRISRMRVPWMSRCFPEDRKETKHPLTRQSMSELYALTMKKKSYIEGKCMKYVCMWEHEFREIYQNDLELRHYLQNLDITDRLDPKESFFGGRTNASQLYYRAKETEQIKYVDFTSLYPWVNKTCQSLLDILT